MNDHRQQSLTDLEAVRKLILCSTGVGAGVPQAMELLRQAKPILSSLLSEVESYRESLQPSDGPGSVVHRAYHNQVVEQLNKELDTVCKRYGEATQEILRLKLEVNRYRDDLHNRNIHEGP